MLGTAPVLIWYSFPTTPSSKIITTLVNISNQRFSYPWLLLGELQVVTSLAFALSPVCPPYPFSAPSVSASSKPVSADCPTWVPSPSRFWCGSGDPRLREGWGTSAPLLPAVLASFLPQPRLLWGSPPRLLQLSVGSGDTVLCLTPVGRTWWALFPTSGCCTIFCVSLHPAFPVIRGPFISLSLLQWVAISCQGLDGHSLTSSHNNSTIVEIEASLVYRIMGDFNNPLRPIDTK